MAVIDVTQQSATTFLVSVDDGAGRTQHEVTVWPSDVERYAPGATPEQLLQASFLFLLAREPKEAILARFELPVIEQYFPEFAEVMGVDR